MFNAQVDVMPTPSVRKPSNKGQSGPHPRTPWPADYQDEVTDEHLIAIKAVVPQEEVDDAETVSGPAW